MQLYASNACMYSGKLKMLLRVKMTEYYKTTNKDRNQLQRKDIKNSYKRQRVEYINLFYITESNTSDYVLQYHCIRLPTIYIQNLISILEHLRLTIENT